MANHGTRFGLEASQAIFCHFLASKFSEFGGRLGHRPEHHKWLLPMSPRMPRQMYRVHLFVNVFR